MKLLKFLTALAFMTFLTGCDPIHHLKIENKTDRQVEVLYSPSLDPNQLGNLKVDSIEFNGKKLYRLFLAYSETMQIGTVTMRFTPEAKDINLDYLEIRNGTDTIRLIGKHAILTTIQKVKKLDWRLIIK